MTTPTTAVLPNPGSTPLPSRMNGRLKTGSAITVAMSTTSDAASATPTFSGRSPAVVSIRYWSASPAAVPPGSSFATAFSLS